MKIYLYIIMIMEDCIINNNLNLDKSIKKKICKDEIIVENITFPVISNNLLIENIQLLTQQYYINNKKTTYLKKNQKLDCSKFIWNNINSSNLLIDSTFIINGNKIYIDYSLFKFYAHPEIYDIIINFIINRIINIINEFDNYEIHINIDGFTISAGERYIQFINMIFLKLFNLTYSKYLYKMYVYNPPLVIEYLRPIFRNIINNKNIVDKVVILK